MIFYTDKTTLFITMFIIYMIFYLVVFMYVKKIKLEKRFESIYEYTYTMDNEFDVYNKKNSILKHFEKYIKKKSIMLEQANIKMETNKFIVYSNISNLLISVLAGYLIGILYLIPLFFLVITYLINSFIKRKIKKRQVQCEKQLISAIRLMNGAIGAGSSPVQALSKVGFEAQEPIKSEFNKIISDLNYGVSYSDSFRKLYLRLPTNNFNLFVNTMIIQRDTGGNLTKILKTMENTLVEKEKLKDKLKALTAQGKLSAIILTVMPYGVAAFISITSPGYLKPLFEGIGLYILGYAIISSIFGWIIVNKIIKVD